MWGSSSEVQRVHVRLDKVHFFSLSFFLFFKIPERSGGPETGVPVGGGSLVETLTLGSEKIKSDASFFSVLNRLMDLNIPQLSAGNA